MTADVFDELTAGNGTQAEAVPAIEFEANEPVADAVMTPLAIKQCCQELLKAGLLEMQRKPRLYQTALNAQDHIRRLLEPFDLDLRLDEIRGLAFVAVADEVVGEDQDDAWSHPLVRRQRLTLEQSLLVAILRKRFLIHEQDAGVGAAGAVVFVDELIPELQVYLRDLGSDLKEQQRMRNLLEKLKGHGIVSEIDDKDQITIRPLIAHLANPENLKALLEEYRRLAESGSVAGKDGS